MKEQQWEKDLLIETLQKRVENRDREIDRLKGELNQAVREAKEYGERLALYRTEFGWGAP